MVAPPAMSQPRQTYYSPLNNEPIPVFMRSNGERTRRRACKRFTGAFVVAVLIYALVNIAMQHTHRFLGDWGDSTPDWPGHRDWLPLDECETTWNDERLRASDTSNNEMLVDIAPYSASTSFELDASAPSLLLLAANTWGDVEFIPSNDDKKSVTVEVVVHYWNEYARERARVCRLDRHDGGQGVGIHVPPYRGPWRRLDRVSFSVTVNFPAVLPSLMTTPLLIKSFETDMSLFTHKLHNFDGAIDFGHLSLRTSNARIQAESLFAEQAELKTSNSGISGKFRTNDSLVLSTSNGRIDISAQLDYSKTASRGKTYLYLKTSNAGIKSDIDLNNPGKKEGGSFDVDAKTSNAQLALSFPNSPHTSYLKLSAHTSNARNEVILNEAFEGSFHARTSAFLGKLYLDRRDGTDPSGEGRRRIVQIRNNQKGVLDGKVSWGAWNDAIHYGEVDTRTSNAPISLTV